MTHIISFDLESKGVKFRLHITDGMACWLDRLYDNGDISSYYLHRLSLGKIDWMHSFSIDIWALMPKEEIRQQVDSIIKRIHDIRLFL